VALPSGSKLGPYESRLRWELGAGDPVTQINVVLNWFEELKRRVPAN